MVLHNNKWDRRAKFKYLKKHGLVAKKDNDRDCGNPRADGSVESSDDDNDLENQSTRANLELGIAIENAFPDDLEDDEEMKMIRAHQRQQQAQHQQQQQPQKSHIQTGSKEMFERAQAGAARSQLNQQVSRFSKKHTEIDLESDSDFEGFMDELDHQDGSSAPSERDDDGPDTTSNASEPRPWSERFSEKQDFLDKIIKK